MLQGFQFIVPYAAGITDIGKRKHAPGYRSPLGSRNVRNFMGGGLVVDWDLKTSLEGLYAAGCSMFAGGAHPEAAATGKYAGRKAADYALKATQSQITREQIEAEKLRVYEPTKRKNGIDWKELNHGINKVMQVYCGEPKNEELLKIGLKLIDDLKWQADSNIYATDPHKLARTLETMDILSSAEIILHACLARKASSRFLCFKRWDYPQMDPEEWHKFITIREENGNVKIGELPLWFWGSLEQNYESHCGL